VVVAFRVAYGGTWRRSAGRAAIVGATYFVAYGLALAALVALALYA
jgi:hypothetical protein